MICRASEVHTVFLYLYWSRVHGQLKRKSCYVPVTAREGPGQCARDQERGAYLLYHATRYLMAWHFQSRSHHRGMGQLPPSNFWEIKTMTIFLLNHQSVENLWKFKKLKKSTKRYFQRISILDSVLSFSTVRLLWSSGKTLAANSGARGFESNQGHKIWFSHFTLLEWNVKNWFCKTDKKL